jgi:hypothetical protein
MSDYITDFECQDCYQIFIWPDDTEPPRYCSGCEEELQNEELKRVQLVAERGESRLNKVLDLAVSGFELIQRLYESSQEARTFAGDGYIYLLGGEGYYKIGRTMNVNRRVRQLEIQLPWPVKLLHTIPCENHKQSEKKLHAMYANRRANGEWFALTGQDVASIQDIARMRGSEIETVFE